MDRWKLCSESQDLTLKTQYETWMNPSMVWLIFFPTNKVLRFIYWQKPRDGPLNSQILNSNETHLKQNAIWHTIYSIFQKLHVAPITVQYQERLAFCCAHRSHNVWQLVSQGSRKACTGEPQFDFQDARQFSIPHYVWIKSEKQKSFQKAGVWKRKSTGKYSMLKSCTRGSSIPRELYWEGWRC